MADPRFDPGSKNRLTTCDLGRFTGSTLFDRIATVVCHAGCLPRKELYEAWEVARRTRRLFRTGRIVDLCAGHGLLAQIMMILDDRSPMALAVDANLPPSHGPLYAAMVGAWPRLAGRVQFAQMRIETVPLSSDDVVVASHPCGALTDVVLRQAVDAGARVAVLPCCHDRATCDAGTLEGWVDASLAIDLRRVAWLEARGYRVWTQRIPEAITPKHRLLLAAPPVKADERVAAANESFG